MNCTNQEEPLNTSGCSHYPILAKLLCPMGARSISALTTPSTTLKCESIGLTMRKASMANSQVVESGMKDRHAQLSLSPRTDPVKKQGCSTWRLLVTKTAASKLIDATEEMDSPRGTQTELSTKTVAEYVSTPFSGSWTYISYLALQCLASKPLRFCTPLAHESSK